MLVAVVIAVLIVVVIAVLIVVVIVVVIAMLIVVIIAMLIAVLIGMNWNTVNRLLTRKRGANIAPLPYFRDTELVGFTLRIRIQ